MAKKNICLVVAYDGTDFHGFQRQTNAASIQACIEQGLSAIFQSPITIYGAARTDAGVHARGQVVNFYGEGSIPTEKIPYAMKGYLPPEIAVLSAKEMPEHFSVRHDNVGKHYRYTIDNNRMHDPFGLRYAWFIRKPLDREAMKEGAAVLLGTHDFSAFEGQNTTPMNPVKTLYSITFHERGHLLDIDVVGDGFYIIWCATLPAVSSIWDSIELRRCGSGKSWKAAIGHSSVPRRRLRDFA